MTDSKKLIIKAIEDSGEKLYDPDSIIISYNEGDAEASIYHDHRMYGAGKIELSKINEAELKDDHVNIWRTWNWTK